MIKRLLRNWVLKSYVKEFREIRKMTDEEEFNKYLFKKSEHVIDIIRMATTSQVIRHFEAENENEKERTKGAALILRIIRDAHLVAWKIHTEVKNPDEKIKMWQKFKKKHRSN